MDHPNHLYQPQICVYLFVSVPTGFGIRIYAADYKAAICQQTQFTRDMRNSISLLWTTYNCQYCQFLHYLFYLYCGTAKHLLMSAVIKLHRDTLQNNNCFFLQRMLIWTQIPTLTIFSYYALSKSVVDIYNIFFAYMQDPFKLLIKTLLTGF